MGSNQSSKRWELLSVVVCKSSGVVVTVFMAWSPAWRSNAKCFEVDHPGGYATLKSNRTRDRTASTMRAPVIMVVNPSVPANTVREFVAYAKANPGTVNMASAGNGSTGHVFGELFKFLTGVNLVHVPYRGGAPAITDLIGGQVQAYFSPISESLQHVRAGKLRALA